MSGTEILALLMLVAFLTAFYMFRVVFLAFFATPAAHHVPVVSGFSPTAGGPPAASAHGASAPKKGGHYETDVVSGFSRTGTHGSHEHDPPAPMLLPLWILALLSMAVGIYSTLAGQAAVLVHSEHEAAAPGWLTPAAVMESVPSPWPLPSPYAQPPELSCVRSQCD